MLKTRGGEVAKEPSGRHEDDGYIGGVLYPRSRGSSCSVI